jgi:hypothetical protein
MKTFADFYKLYDKKYGCNVCPNELKPGDRIENINPECDHFRSCGEVQSIEKVEQDDERTAGNLVVYLVTNDSSDFNPRDLNGVFKRGDILKKTEIQLRKVK